LQVPSRGKPCPLYLAVSQDDIYQNGILIYWSRKNKNPDEDDNEGRFNVQKENKKLLCINTRSDSQF